MRESQIFDGARPDQTCRPYDEVRARMRWADFYHDWQLQEQDPVRKAAAEAEQEERDAAPPTEPYTLKGHDDSTCALLSCAC